MLVEILVVKIKKTVLNKKKTVIFFQKKFFNFITAFFTLIFVYNIPLKLKNQSMKLIFIHGRAQETFEELALRQIWIDTLNEGLKKSGLSMPSNVTIEFPYYGKLLKKLVDEFEAVGTRDIGGPDEEDFEKMVFFQDFLIEMTDKIDMPTEEKMELLESQTTSRGILNWEIVQSLLERIDHRDYFGELAIKKFTYDVFMYLTAGDVKKQINQLIEKYFNDEPCVVVGHSLGSIVSYLVLKNNPQFKVKKYITVGSPLGSVSVNKYLELPLEMPQCVQDGWFNAYDERDVVALNPLDNRYFDINPSIENKNDVNNHTDNRHGIVGYLNDAVIAKKIYDALTP